MTATNTHSPKRIFVEHGRLLLDVENGQIASFLENPERTDPPLGHPLSDMLSLPAELQPSDYQKYVRFYKRKDAYYQQSYHAATRLPRDQRPRSYFNDLLRALAAGDTSAPRDILEYRDDPRARGALAAATATIALKHLPNYVQSLTIIGGSRARTVLRRRLNQLLPDSARPHRWRSRDRITATVSVAQHLVELDPAATVAAYAIAAFLAHPVSWVRERATVALTEVMEPHARTPAMQVLRRALDTLMAAPDHGAFARAARLLHSLYPGPVLERLQRALTEGDRETRPRAASLLISIQDAGSWTPLVDWIQHEPSIHAVIACAPAIEPPLPPKVKTAIINRAFSHPSPRVRLDAIRLLHLVPAESLRRVVRRLASSEPDLIIRRQLLDFEMARAQSQQAEPP